MNALKLCISALPTCTTAEDAIAFLLDIEQAADGLVQALDSYEAELRQAAT